MDEAEKKDSTPDSWNSTAACFECLGTRLEQVFNLLEMSPAQRDDFLHTMEARYGHTVQDLKGPAFTRDVYRELTRRHQSAQSFWPYKKRMNDLALDLQTMLKVRTRIAGNTYRTALRIALAGTLVDFLQQSHEEIISTVDSLIIRQLAVDHYPELSQKTNRNSRVLYLGDQAGEIVFDRLFIRYMGARHITYVVNDCQAGLTASGQDADYVDMRHYAHVLSNGCNTPHTSLELGTERLQKEFEQATVIIAKGQSNLEALFDLHDPRVFALFTCQCKRAAQEFHIEMGDTVILNPEQRLREVQS